MTQQEINFIIEDYKNGDTMDALIKKYHHSYETIIKVLKENNIHIRKKSEALKGKEKTLIDKETENKIVEEYLSGKGVAVSGKKIQCYSI